MIRAATILAITTWLVPAMGVAAPATAAGGAVIEPDRLDGEARAELSAAIANARRTQPAAFQAVATVRAGVARVDASKRGRYGTISRPLKDLGPDALYPMLEMLAFKATPRGDLTDSAWLTLRVGLLEAVGALRDPRSAPVLGAILDSEAAADFHIGRAGAEALGLLGDDASAAKLVALAQTAGPRQRGVLAGMGSCRRPACARALASALPAAPDAEGTKEVIKSLGDVGSAWAWKTPELAGKPEQAAVRAAAAQALVTAFVTHDGALRQAASNALMVVDDPSTPALITRARAGASPALGTALDDLSARFARNPAR